MTYDPEHFMESTLRSIKEYVEANVNTRIYDVVMEFPGSIIDAGELPPKKTMIAFEIDAMDTRPVGMGDGIFNVNYNDTDGTVTPQYADMIDIHFDVGVWASDRSGGTTQRMRARQVLETLFGVGGIEKLRTFSDGGDGGIEIRSFTGGRFITDSSANDIRLYRMIDTMLVVRVFSRTPLAQAEAGPALEEIDQAPNLTIIG